MKVYVDEGGDKRLIGRADVPPEEGPIYEVPLFGTASVIVERYTIGTVTRFPQSPVLRQSNAQCCLRFNNDQNCSLDGSPWRPDDPE
ncbi:hypothetical protein ACFQU2_41925 [Siccirubricoccus deserti]